MARAHVVACWFLLLAVAAALAAAFAFVIPVEVTVDEASVGLNLITFRNGTLTCLSIDLSLEVAVHNHNWAMRVRRTAPLYAQLGFSGPTGVTGFVLQLAGAGDVDRIRRSSMAVYREAWGLGCFAAPDFARERASGVLELDVIVTGEFMYQAHPHGRNLKVSCPLKIPISTAKTVPAAFARAKCI